MGSKKEFEAGKNCNCPSCANWVWGVENRCDQAVSPQVEGRVETGGSAQPDGRAEYVQVEGGVTKGRDPQAGAQPSEIAKAAEPIGEVPGVAEAAPPNRYHQPDGRAECLDVQVEGGKTKGRDSRQPSEIHASEAPGVAKAAKTYRGQAVSHDLVVAADEPEGAGGPPGTSGNPGEAFAARVSGGLGEVVDYASNDHMMRLFQGVHVIPADSIAKPEPTQDKHAQPAKNQPVEASYVKHSEDNASKVQAGGQPSAAREGSEDESSKVVPVADEESSEDEASLEPDTAPEDVSHNDTIESVKSVTSTDGDENSGRAEHTSDQNEKEGATSNSDGDEDHQRNAHPASNQDSDEDATDQGDEKENVSGQSDEKEDHRNEHPASDQDGHEDVTSGQSDEKENRQRNVESGGEDETGDGRGSGEHSSDKGGSDNGSKPGQAKRKRTGRRRTRRAD